MPDVAELALSDLVAELIEPIPGDSPSGKDAANEEEYFKLNMEFPKTSPDYKTWIELSNIILKEKSKDIKVAVWLCFALYRTENIKGLKQGLELILQLLKRFENNLFPANPLLRSKAIQFLNTARVTKLLEREEINRSNAEDLISVSNLVSEIVKESERLLPENVPALNTFSEIIANHVETAKKVLNPPAQPEKKVISIKPAVSEVKPKIQAPVKEQPPADTSSSAKLSEDDALVQLRRTLNHFFESVQDGETKERIPESFFVFGIASQIQWSNLILPPAEDKITYIEPPNEVVQRIIKQWFSENKIDMLIPRIELEFIKDNSEFRYWLDAHRYLVNSLEKKGGNFTSAAEDIKFHLARLIKRLPEIQTYKFRGGELPFADPETIKWIEDEVKQSALGIRAVESTAFVPTQVIEKGFDHLSEEYQQMVSELPKNFEQNFDKIQNGIAGETSLKGKFLRRLNLSNYCYEAKQYSVAKVNLEELNKIINELNLNEWEPNLSSSVWQSLYLTNVQLLFNANSESTKTLLEKEQEELFYKIARYNGILAINLEQQKHKRRK